MFTKGQQVKVIGTPGMPAVYVGQTGTVDAVQADGTVDIWFTGMVGEHNFGTTELESAAPTPDPSKITLGKAAWKVLERAHWAVAGSRTTYLSQHGTSAVSECRNRGLVTVDKAAGTATLTDLGRQMAEIVWGAR